MAGAVVELDAALFRELYPDYASATDAKIGQWFDQACLLVGNRPGSAIPYDPPSVTTRKTILYVVMCHLAALTARGDLVGRATQASEGSVSVQLSSGLDGGRGGAWWQQTQCGATAWQMLAPFRTGGKWFGGVKY